MTTNLTDLKQYIELICIERGLEVDEVLAAIEIAVAAAYRKEYGDKDKAFEAKFNLDTGKYTILQTWTIVENPIEGEEEMFHPGKELTITEARLSNPEAAVGDVIRKEVVIDDEVYFGRIASQVAKQVLFQTINNVRHSKILQQFRDKIGDIVTVEIDCFRKGGYLVKLGQTTGYIGREHLLPVDKFKPGQTVRALIVDITEDERGNSRVVLSRTNNDFVKAIIAKEVPEVGSGIVTIDKIVREPGSRTKLLVTAVDDETIDPVGTILGRKNVRLINIMREITTTLQEKIDIIEKRDDIEGMIMDSLEPAEIDHVNFDLKTRKADVFCYPEEASLAVGKRGVNIRLASDLLNVELNIVTMDEDDITELNPSKQDDEPEMISVNVEENEEVAVITDSTDDTNTEREPVTVPTDEEEDMDDFVNEAQV